MSSAFRRLPGWRSRTRSRRLPLRSEGGSAREPRKVGSGAGDESPAEGREGGATRIRHRRSRVAFTCIFHLSFRGVALPGSTYSPPSNQRALPATSRAPADSHWPRRIDVAANPSSSRGCILLFYLPTLRGDGGGGDGGDACALLFSTPFYDILTTLHARTRPGGRSARSYLRYENATPTIFLLFRRYRRLRRAPPLEGQREDSVSPLRPGLSR